MPYFYRECHCCGKLNPIPGKYNTREEAYIDNQENQDLFCLFCGQTVCESNFSVDKWWGSDSADAYEIFNKEKGYEQALYDFYVKPNPENGKFYFKRLEEEKRREESHKQLMEELDAINKKKQQNHSYSSNEITCPTCHSTNVVKIDGLERGTSILMWGLFSKKRDKTFKCKHCGYMW